MTTSGLTAVIQEIMDDPALLGLGDLEVRRVLPGCHVKHAGLLLEDRAEAIFYVVDLQSGPADDRQVIRVVERWEAERRRYPGRRCYAVLVAGEVAARFRQVLTMIGQAVPVIAVEMQVSEAAPAIAPRFTPVRLRLR